MSTKEADRSGYAVVDLQMRIYLEPSVSGDTIKRLALMAEITVGKAIVEDLDLATAVRVNEFTASFPSAKAVAARLKREAEATPAPGGEGQP